MVKSHLAHNGNLDGYGLSIYGLTLFELRNDI